MRTSVDQAGRPPADVRRGIRWGAAVATLAFGALVSGGGISGLLERGPYTSDFYDAQARAVLDGRLDVDRDLAGIEGFERDGRTYLYFGLMPALLRIPVVAVSDGFDGRLTQLSMMLAMAVASRAAGRLAWRARVERRGPGVPSRTERRAVGVFAAAVGLSSPLLFLASRPLVYHEAELWGVALALVAADRLLAWWQDPSARALAIASLTAGLALHARPSVGGGALAALGLAVLARWRDGLGAAALRAGAVLVPLLLYGAVNVARFDHPTTVPFDLQRLAEFDEVRQAALAETDGTLFGLEYVPTDTWSYLRPDGVRVQRLFPWITYRESTDVIGDATFDTIDRTASLPVAAPALGLLALAGAASIVTRRRPGLVPWAALAGGAGMGTTLTVTIGFIAHRYLSDFVPLLVVLAAGGLWTAADVVRRWTTGPRRAAVAGLGLLALAGLVVEVALSLQSQRLLILPDEDGRRDFVALQYRIDDALGAGAPPDVRRDPDLSVPARRGEVAIIGACEGLYWSDGRRWTPLELSGARGWRLEGDLPTGRTVLLRGAQWQIVLDGTGDDVRVSHLAQGQRPRRGPPIRRSAIADRPIDLRLDLLTPEVTVRAGDVELLRGWLARLDGPVVPGPDLASSALATPLCDRLDRALDQGSRSARSSS